MQSNTTDTASLKILAAVKSGSGILYPDLVLDGTASQPQATPGEPVLTWDNFSLLGKLRTSLSTIWGSLVLKETSPHTDIAFYGCTAKVGTSFLSFHMALFIALSQGLRTAYIDTDLNKPANNAHPIGSTNLTGLESYYFENVALEDCLHATRVPNLVVLPSGKKTVEKQDTQFPPVQKMKALTSALCDRFEAVVYDCQPILVSPIGISYAQHARHILIVSHYAASRREVCQQSAEIFRANDLEVTGVILNKREYPIPMKLYDLLK